MIRDLHQACSKPALNLHQTWRAHVFQLAAIWGAVGLCAWAATDLRNLGDR